MLTKSGSLWVAWLKEYVFKHRDYWDILPSLSHSWATKKLLKLKALASTVLQQIQGEFKVHLAWRIIREKNPKVYWHRLIWYTKYVPKHSLIAWMVILNKLPTKEKLVNWGLHLQDDLCPLCQLSQESRNHLFFCCPFTKEVWSRVLALNGIHRTPQDWDTELRWCVSNFKGNSFLALLCRLCWSSTLYFIWHERNRRVHGESPQNPSQVLLQIARVIQNRSYTVGYIANDHINIALCHRWGISDHILH